MADAPQAPADALLAHADDASLTAYVDPATGQIQMWRNPPPEKIKALGLERATQEQIERRADLLKNTTTGAQAKTAGKLAANVATFGLAGFSDKQSLQQIKDFRDVSPTMATLTEVAGAAAPGILGAGVGGAALEGLGLAGRALSIGTTIAEEVAASTAVGKERALEEGRNIELADVISGVPLALGMSAAARLARVGTSFASHAAGRAERRAASALPEVAGEANAISKGAATGRARRSVGAAGAADDARVPLSEAEVRSRAENIDQVTAETNKAAGDTFDELFGNDDALFRDVHSTMHKDTDFLGRMGDVDRETVSRFTAEHVNVLQDTARKLEAKGATQMAARVNGDAERLKGLYKTLADEPAHMANGFDTAKQTLDRGISKYGALSDAHAVDIAEILEESATKLRSGLEDSSVWGKAWAEHQREINALWSGPDGFIRNAAYLNGTVMKRKPGAAGRVREGARELPVFESRGDITERYLAMNDKDYLTETRAARKALERMRDMSLIKTELGTPSMGSTPVMRLQTNVDKALTVFDELDNIRDAMLKRGGKDIAAKATARRATVGGLEHAYELGEHLPVVGHTLKAGRKLYEHGTGKAMFETPVLPARPELTSEAAYEAVRGRARRGAKPEYHAPPPISPRDGGAIPRPGPRGVPDAAASEQGYAPQAEARRRQAGSASVGVLAGAAGLGVAGLAVHPVTNLLSDMSADQKAIRERAALGLTVPATRPRPLPSSIQRFTDGAPLAAAFAMRRDDLITALSNPEALLAGLDDAYGDLADSHPELYGDILARSHAAAQYVMANAPPSVAIGLTRPDGINPDPLALAKMADIWSGAFNPGDVIYDVGTGDATPTQIKALKEVHPDVYDALRLDIMKAVGDASGSMPFETLRKLDVLFDVPGIAPPSFQPQMTQTMQGVWTQRPGGNQTAPTGAGAPTSATAKFAAGPSNMQ